MSQKHVAEVLRKLRRLVPKTAENRAEVLRKCLRRLRKSGCKSLKLLAEVLRRFAEVPPSPYGGDARRGGASPLGVGRSVAR